MQTTSDRALSKGTYAFSQIGAAPIERAASTSVVAQLEAYFPRLPARTAGARACDFTAEARDWIKANVELNALASELLKAPARVSRIQGFDKSPDANWFVPWHQDRAEDGQERAIAQLERTVALRIHLDDCLEDNGPLEVLPGTHTRGRLEAAAIAQSVAEIGPLVCLARRGDVIAMRPLIVHRSQRATRPAARRVVHIEYTAVI